MFMVQQLYVFLRTNQNIIVYMSLSAGSPQPPNNSVESSLTLATKAKSQHFIEFSLDSIRTAQVCVGLKRRNRSQQRLTHIYSK